MKRSLVDANVLLRLILRDDERLFAMAYQIINKALPNSLVVTLVTAGEVLYVLGPKDYNRKQSVDALMLLIDRPQFKQSELLSNSLRLYSETKLDYADCYLLVRALSKGEKIKTLDGQLLKTYNLLKKPT